MKQPQTWAEFIKAWSDIALRFCALLVFFVSIGFIAYHWDKVKVTEIVIGREGVAHMVLAVEEPAEPPEFAKMLSAQVPQSVLVPSSNDRFWVYLGEATKQQPDTFVTRYFAVGVPPAEGDTITSLTKVTRRASAPFQTTEGEWRLGLAEGVLPTDERVEVFEPLVIAGANDRQFWWARVALDSVQ
jgi:hypothetical protein